MPLAESMQRYESERVNPPGAQTACSNYATDFSCDFHCLDLRPATDQ